MARSVIISFYLSPDSTFDSVDTLLEQITLSPLPGGKETKKKFAATLPVGTRASGQFIIGMIDATNRIAEIDETGNTTVFGPVP
jgi:subtilase family serine protease